MHIGMYDEACTSTCLCVFRRSNVFAVSNVYTNGGQTGSMTRAFSVSFLHDGSIRSLPPRRRNCSQSRLDCGHSKCLRGELP